MTNTKQLISFLDTVQRTVIGELISETDTTTTVRNPVIVHIEARRDPRTGEPTGQMAIQLLPIFFREFAADKEAPADFTYNKSQITLIKVDGDYDFKLYSMFDQISAPPPAQQAPATGPVEPVKLFDN